ncbi:hypothetical protein LINPERHAP2_LOCUS14663 [Linum perenne]
MDKSWMSKKTFSIDYIEGVKSFMHFVEDHIGRDDDIHCPCKNCLNVYIEPQEVVLAHLMVNGIDSGYTTWIYHENRDYDDLENAQLREINNKLNEMNNRLRQRLSELEERMKELRERQRMTDQRQQKYDKVLEQLAAKGMINMNK